MKKQKLQRNGDSQSRDVYALHHSGIGVIVQWFLHFLFELVSASEMIYQKKLCVCVCEFDIKSKLFFSFVYSWTQKLFGKRSPAAGVEVKLLPKE